MFLKTHTRDSNCYYGRGIWSVFMLLYWRKNTPEWYLCFEVLMSRNLSPWSLTFCWVKSTAMLKLITRVQYQIYTAFNCMFKEYKTFKSYLKKVVRNHKILHITTHHHIYLPSNDSWRTVLINVQNKLWKLFTVLQMQSCSTKIFFPSM